MNPKFDGLGRQLFQVRVSLARMSLMFAVLLWVVNSPAAFAFQVGVDDATLSDLAQAATAPKPSVKAEPISSGINFLELLLRGGWFMAPLAAMSLLVVTIALERAIGLRRNHVIPRRLVKGLGDLAKEDDTLDPRAAYKLCQKYPSAAATVIRTMLLKVGRPHSEIEHAVAEASQREAERLHSNVRWLNMASAVSPLLGLLGTVWGLIEAFHATTLIQPGQDRTLQLAGGIYSALVTTLGGLIVAIPSAIFAHFFEGRIASLFRQIDELLFHLLPQIERFEGSSRFVPNKSELIDRTFDPAKPASETQRSGEAQQKSVGPTSPPKSNVLERSTRFKG